MGTISSCKLKLGNFLYPIGSYNCAKFEGNCRYWVSGLYHVYMEFPCCKNVFSKDSKTFDQSYNLGKTLTEAFQELVVYILRSNLVNPTKYWNPWYVVCYLVEKNFILEHGLIVILVSYAIFWFSHNHLNFNSFHAIGLSKKHQKVKVFFMFSGGIERYQ